MTICFHLDDYKQSHCKKKTNDLMTKWFRKEYKIIFEERSGNMVVSRVNVNVYLGMPLDYRIRGRVNITMFDYIE